MKNPQATLSMERTFAASPRKIFSVFERGELLAQWWGPDGFTNSFQTFEFKSGGKWVFVMHAPNGDNYPNESLFREVRPDARVVIEHVAQPHFTLTIQLTPQGDRTHLRWEQEFETAEMADKLRPMCEPANEQNLNRLATLLAKLPG